MTTLDRDLFIREYVALNSRINSLSNALGEKRFDPNTHLKVSNMTLQ